MVYQAYKWVIPPIFTRWLIVVVLCVLLDGASMLGWLRVGVTWILTPILNTSGYMMSQGQRVVRYGQQLHESARENLDLERKIDELRVTADRATLLEAENQELRNRLELPQPKSVKMTPARVVMRDGARWRIALTDTALVGSMVLYKERVVGVVSAAHGYVGTFTTVGGGEEAELSLRSASVNTSLGKAALDGNVLVIDQVSKDVSVTVGDLLVTIGDGAAILPDYPVANVLAVNSQPEAIYQSLQLSPLEEISVGEVVWIVGEENL